MRHYSVLAFICISLILPPSLGCRRRTTAITDSHDHGAASHDSSGHAGGHGHGEEDGPAPVVVTLFTQKVELFMEYPQLVKSQEAEFLAHFSVLATGEPVRTGSLAFEATGPDGKVVSQKLDAPKRDGLFVPTLTFAAIGTYKLRLVVNSPQVQETIDVGEIQVHPDAAAAEQAATKAAQPELPNVVPFLMEQQWKIDMLLGQAEKRTLVHRILTPGQVTAPEGASAVISPPVSGRLVAPPNGRIPQLGETVQAGQVVALVEPPLPVTELYQLRANQAQLQSLQIEFALRELDLESKAMQAERSLSQAKARLDYAQRVMDRAAELRKGGVSSQQQFDEAEQNLRLAKAELASAEAAQKAYKDWRQRLAKIQTQVTSRPAEPHLGLHERPDDRASAGSLQLPLVSPISGQIVSVGKKPGEHVEAGKDEVFRIVDSGKVWVRAQIPEADLAGVPSQPTATISFPSLPQILFEIPGQRDGRLVHFSNIVDPETRSVTLIYELPNQAAQLKVGMFADVSLGTTKAEDAVAIPESAVVLDNGRPIAFALIDGENFQRRDLRIGIRDRGFVQVISGIEPGERVAAKGAYAVKLSSLSPAAFGHGHGH
jgi:multidrug efflux pump subunit AcrA (membrane-fusion protein)